MDLKVQEPVTCKQCKKDIKTEAYMCVPCQKFMHPSCAKLHKVYKGTELVPCAGKIEKHTVVKSDGASTSGTRERSGSTTFVSSATVNTGGAMDRRIESIYRTIKEIKEELIGKEFIRQAITEAIEDEMDRVRQEIQHWRTSELKEAISKAVKKELQNVMSLIPDISREQGAPKKSYSGAVKNKSESVIIIRPKDEEPENTSEETKKDLKNKVDVTKLGVGITKMKKATNGAIVVGCENKDQVRKLKDEVNRDLGDKYIIQEPKKRKLKIRIHDVDKEDSQDEQEFWQKIQEQNELSREAAEGKILHIAPNKFKGVTIIAEVRAETRERLLELGKLKIGWKICKVQDYVGVTRCFKCCGFYHFAKDCTRKEACGKCAGQHATKECESEAKKCINCEEKIKKFGIKDLKSDHTAYDSSCPCLRKEIEKQKERVLVSNNI